MTNQLLQNNGPMFIFIARAFSAVGADRLGYINLKGMPDAPTVGKSQGEIVTYLERASGGSEFRNNDGMRTRWFTEEGKLDHTKINTAQDVYNLIVPSKKRALELNKAYRVIVEDQDFIFGRDATVTPPVNVFEKIDNSKTLPLPADKFYRWDIRLNWSQPRALLADKQHFYTLDNL